MQERGEYGGKQVQAGRKVKTNREKMQENRVRTGLTPIEVRLNPTCRHATIPGKSPLTAVRSGFV